MSEIRCGYPDDFALVMERVVASFREGNPGHLRFEGLYPDTIRPDKEAMGQWRLAFVGAELAAGLQVVPRPMTLAGEVTLMVAGVGNVFCYPEFRGQGLMSSLLHHCLGEMAAAGVELSMLGGDRTRYGHFGWEHAGAVRQLTLSARVGRHQERALVSGSQLRTWNGDEGDIARMYAAYGRLAYRTGRTLPEFAAVMRRPGVVVWISDTPEEGFAYLALRQGSIAEYAGEAAALERLLAFLLRNGNWGVTLPPVDGETPADAVFLPLAQHFQVVPAAMIRIVSLERTMAAYLPLLQERLRGWEGRLILECAEEGERVQLGSNGTSLQVKAVEGDDAAGLGRDAVLCLSRAEMTRLLFGPFPPALGARQQDEILRRAFPLPVYWHPLSRV